LCVSSYTFSVIIYVKNSANFEIMGYSVRIPSEDRVMIMDSRNEMDEDTATIIVTYLFDEGFIDEDKAEEIVCEIISN